MPPVKAGSENTLEDQQNGEIHEEEQDGTKERQDSNNSNTDSEGQESPFKHPSLKGKTHEQIEAYLVATEGAAREAGQRLSRAEKLLETIPQRQEQAQEETPKGRKKRTSAEFFEDPDASFDEFEKRIEDKVEKIMTKMIAPFNQNLAETRNRGVWAELEAEKPGMNSYKPMIEDLLSEFKIKTPDLATLRAMYYMAKGKVDEELASQDGNGQRGRNRQRDEEEEEEQDERPKRRPPPPQHLPSNQPLNVQRNRGKRYRELTESEKTVARMRNLTDAQYLDNLDEDIDITTPFTQPTKRT